jgi:transcription elongation GreA/GreB family factor
VNKHALIKQIIAQLASGLELYYHAARASRAEATHEQNKAENKYDTRGLEASYLARGQSRQAAETEKDIQQFEALVVRPFNPAEPIDIGALVELKGKDGGTFYFMGPRAGGTEVIHEGTEVLVITPQSPLGQQLLGKKTGDRFQLQIAGARSLFQVVSVT